jgi:hypothetical protein
MISASAIGDGDWARATICAIFLAASSVSNMVGSGQVGSVGIDEKASAEPVSTRAAAM